MDNLTTPERLAAIRKEHDSDLALIAMKRVSGDGPSGQDWITFTHKAHDRCRDLLSELDRLTAASGDHRAVAEEVALDIRKRIVGRDGYCPAMTDVEATDAITQAITAAVAAEGEQCAKVAENYVLTVTIGSVETKLPGYGNHTAAAIRARHTAERGKR